MTGSRSLVDGDINRAFVPEDHDVTSCVHTEQE